ncbi:MAG: (Fe-S)-binding protein [Planctomycetes bacterium]|nr:(Fe-S)-binding protein [Planctomycetota bacterium]
MTVAATARDRGDPHELPTSLPSTDGLDAARGVLARAVGGLGCFQLDACLRCGLCNDACHIYLAEPEPANLPAAKAAQVTRLFRRYHTPLGRWLPRLAGAHELNANALRELGDAVYGRCTACGRCALACGIGLDLRDILRVGRQMCAAAGLVPDGLERTVKNQLETGNQMAIAREELLSTAAWLSEDLQAEMGDPAARVHVDEKGKRVFYLVNPREVKFFPLSLLAAAGVFHAAGESWTMSSRFYDVTNYGFYAGDDAAARELTRRVIEEAVALGAEEIVLSECGHGYRSFRWEGPRWLGRAYPLAIRSVLELLEEYLDTGRIRVDPAKNPARVTLHDPCNLVRLGGLVEPQRRVLARVTQDFVEMTPNRAQNFCCGGGGGMLSMSEYGERRVRSGRIKADQIRATGARVVATPCHNCADQLLELSKKYGLGTEIQAVVELVYSALVYPATREPPGAASARTVARLPD